MMKPADTLASATFTGGHTPRMNVSSYEKVASWLIAMLIFVGTIVGCLLAIWLPRRNQQAQRTYPVIMESFGGRGDHPPGIGRDDKPLGDGELPEAGEPEFARTLAFVAEASVQAGQLALAGSDSTIVGSGSGLGDSRPPGALGEGRGDGIPRHERWELHFPAGNTLATYGRQLDFFKIELAVLGPGDQVQYVSGFSKSQPQVRRGTSSAERRLYMTWRRGSLEQADRDLVRRAGVDSTGKMVLQFLDPEIENQLAVLELEYAKRPVNRIRRTRFGVVDDGSGGYRFVVQQQQYR